MLTSVLASWFLVTYKSGRVTVECSLETLCWSILLVLGIYTCSSSMLLMFLSGAMIGLRQMGHTPRISSHLNTHLQWRHENITVRSALCWQEHDQGQNWKHCFQHFTMSPWTIPNHHYSLWVIALTKISDNLKTQCYYHLVVKAWKFLALANCCAVTFMFCVVSVTPFDVRLNH